MVFIHELTHALKGSEDYSVLEELANKNISKSDRQKIEGAYKEFGDKVSDEMVREEVTSWYIENEMDSDSLLSELA